MFEIYNSTRDKKYTRKHEVIRVINGNPVYLQNLTNIVIAGSSFDCISAGTVTVLNLQPAKF